MTMKMNKKEYDERKVAEELLLYIINNSNHIHTIYTDKFYKKSLWNGLMDAIDNFMKLTLSVTQLNRFVQCKYYNNAIDTWVSNQIWNGKSLKRVYNI